MKVDKLLIHLVLIVYFIITIFLSTYSYKLLIVFLGISVLIFFITKLRFEPFLSILIVAFILGLLLGLSPTNFIDSIEKGTGTLLGHLSLILALGAMFGKVLEELGAVDIASKKLINLFGVSKIQLGLLVAGMCISFSLFFDVAFILVIPIILSVARELELNKMYLALPTSIGVLTVHALFPPHPSPSIIVRTFNLNMGEVFLYGLIVAIPTAIIGGILLTNSKLIDIKQKKKTKFIDKTLFEIKNTTISPISSILLIFLITLPTILLNIPNVSPNTIAFLTVISNPVTALLISLVVAIAILMKSRDKKIFEITPILSSSIKNIAVVLLINGAAGGLKQVLVDSKITDEIVTLTSNLNLSPLVISFVIASVLRIALGSATVAAITTLAIAEPFISAVPYSPTFIMLSITAGSIFCSHVNDPGFWLFKQYLNLDFKTTFKTWTLGTSVASLIAFCIILIMTSII